MTCEKLEQMGKELEKEAFDRKRAEEEHEKMQAMLFQAQKMESLGILVSCVAHEINNPINTIEVDPSLPCVLVTAYGNEEIRKEAESIGSCQYMEKPLKPEEIIGVITRIKK